MKRAINVIKAALLLAALAILASSALPGTARAGADPVAGDNCAGTGETCHFVADGVVYHSIKQ